MRNDHQTLIKSLGDAAGLPDLEFDASGHCALSFDDLVLDFEYLAEADSVLVYGKVGELPPGNRTEAMKKVLELSSAAALSGKGTFATDFDTGAIFFVERIAVAAMNDSAFQAAVESIVDDAEYWDGTLNDIIRDNGASEKAPTPEEQFAIRV